MTATTLPQSVLGPLVATAQQLAADDKGLLAADESVHTCNARFARLGIPQDEPTRRAWRELILTTPGLGDAVSGVILVDETIRERSHDGTSFPDVLARAGILVGIKVDSGTTALAGHPGETVTEGLDGLRARLADHHRRGARFAKWRAVLTIGEETPSAACVAANAHALARCAALCQEAGLVPVVEPEVLMAGGHGLDRCEQVTEDVLHAVFAELRTQGVVLEAVVLKPNMVTPGSECPDVVSVEAVATATLRCLLRAVPAAVAGVAFLSGGQTGDLACARLAAMNTPALRPLPWPVTFSFGRAIQQPALATWGGRHATGAEAQHFLLTRATAARDARRGVPAPPVTPRVPAPGTAS